MTNISRRWTARWAGALILSAGLLIPNAAPSAADGCDDGSGGPGPAGSCADPAPPQGNPPWLGALQQRDPQFVESYSAMRARILKDGAIPAKYKLLMGM